MRSARMASLPVLRAALILTAFTSATAASAQAPVRLAEAFAPGYEYHVSSRVEITGSLTLPPEKAGEAAKKLAVTGKSAIEYDERVLGREQDGRVGKRVLLYRRSCFQRKLGAPPPQATLPP